LEGTPGTFEDPVYQRSKEYWQLRDILKRQADYLENEGVLVGKVHDETIIEEMLA
jgi:hypothetical protein